jgi:hypothetical protein
MESKKFIINESLFIQGNTKITSISKSSPVMNISGVPNVDEYGSIYYIKVLIGGMISSNNTKISIECIGGADNGKEIIISIDQPFLLMNSGLTIDYTSTDIKLNKNDMWIINILSNKYILDTRIFNHDDKIGNDVIHEKIARFMKYKNKSNVLLKNIFISSKEEFSYLLKDNSNYIPIPLDVNEEFKIGSDIPCFPFIIIEKTGVITEFEINTFSYQ